MLCVCSQKLRVHGEMSACLGNKREFLLLDDINIHYIQFLKVLDINVYLSHLTLFSCEYSVDKSPV